MIIVVDKEGLASLSARVAAKALFVAYTVLHGEQREMRDNDRSQAPRGALATKNGTVTTYTWTRVMPPRIGHLSLLTPGGQLTVREPPMGGEASGTDAVDDDELARVRERHAALETDLAKAVEALFPGAVRVQYVTHL